MRFKKVKVNQTKLCWNEQDLYFHQKTIREYSVKHDSFFHTCLTFCKYVWEKPNLCVKYHTCSFWQMFDFYPTCLEKTKHVGIFTPGCYFPHMFGFWHIGMGKGTHVCKKPHNYMFANVWHFPHMCGKSHWHAYFPLSYGCWRVCTSWQIHVQNGKKFGLLNTILNLPKTKSKYFAENPNLGDSSSGNTIPGLNQLTKLRGG